MDFSNPNKNHNLNHADFPKELCDDINNKWDEFCHSVEKFGVFLPDDSAFLAALKHVFALSDFVSKSCIRSPGLLADLAKTGDLKRKYPEDEYIHKLDSSLSGVDEEKVFGSILHKVRLREMIRIAWRDLAGWADLSETTADLSAFADACIKRSLSFLYKNLSSTYGIPIGTDGCQQNLVVVAMGKLGARELNFSSDIDLIFAYPLSGSTEGCAKSISNDEFFVRLGRRLINLIGAATSDGMLFRVDMRLRPYGENGPLVMSFDNMENYYQSQGREWERYAWIKSRAVTFEDSVGAEILERLKPFVFRRYLDFGTFESLREMKQMISLEVKRKGMKNNVKLGPGGIREVEFFGQIFQLVRGGINPLFQKRPIQKILQVLVQENYISQEVFNQLNDAYIFLRNTEHRLQEFADQQTHTLPADSVGKIRLAVSMGYKSWESFSLQLARHMNNVHFHFNTLLKTEDTEKSGEGLAPNEKPDKKTGESQDEKFENELKAIWEESVDDKQSRKILFAAGFDKQAEVLGLLANLRDDFNTKALSGDGRQRLDRLIPLILKETGHSKQPLFILNRIIELIKTIERRTCYLSLLLENRSTLSHLVKLSDASPWITSFLTRHPVLLDELLDPRTLYAPPLKKDIERELVQRIKNLPQQDLEYQMEELCIFKQVNILRVAAADVCGSIPLMKVSDHLTDIAETVINQVLELAWNHLVEKHGEPSFASKGDRNDRGFAVIAYGKLGGIELGYGSDLDLVFLHSGSKGLTKGVDRPIDNAHFYSRLGQRVIHILTTHTPAGTLYETDTRLRPSGSSGLLVSHIDSFEDYQTKKAWTWEHQAIIRARAISGDNYLARRFEQIRKKVLARSRKKDNLQKEVGDMREKMRKELSSHKSEIFDIKQDPGGMVDIEFLVQYLVLLKSHEYNELLKWTDNVRLLQTLAEKNILENDTALFLKETYLTYRLSAHRLSLQEKPAIVPKDKFHVLQKRVKDIWTSFIVG